MKLGRPNGSLFFREAPLPGDSSIAHTPARLDTWSRDVGDTWLDQNNGLDIPSLGELGC